MTDNKKKIVIVGAGAGGLELAARLSRSKLNKKKFELTVIDPKLKHVWKPLLHEVATGTLLSSEDEIDYLNYAGGRFHWEYGRIKAINRAEKIAIVNKIIDAGGQEILPERKIRYDILVLAIGSISNDFNIPGVQEHCVFLDSVQQAENVNKLLMQQIIKLLSGNVGKTTLQIAIIGGGATGVELAAEIHYAMGEAHKLSSSQIRNFNLEIKVIESANRILPQLPERISKAVTKFFEKIGINIYTNKLVNEIKAQTILTKDGTSIKADLIIWAAGVKIDPVVKNFDELELNVINQICVNNTLQTTRDESIYAFGDCAACPQVLHGKIAFVPPRAQAAHQQASLLSKSLIRVINGNQPLVFKYKDYGSLIIVSKYDTFGNLMNRISKSIYIEGMIARWTYWMLYKKHQTVLWGLPRVILMTIANFIASRFRPKLKLH